MDHPFTRDLGADRIRVLADCAQELIVAAGSYLWRQGQRPDALLLVGSGELSLEISIPNEGPLEIDSFGSGEAHGDWLEPSTPCDFDLRAVTSVQGVLLRGDSLRAACERDSVLGYELLKRWAAVKAGRLRRARQRLMEPQGGIIPRSMD